MSVPKYMVLDVDTGIDDAWALYLLLRLKQPDTTILGITCVRGNTEVDNVSRNTRYLLAACGHSDIPVYRGCPRPLLPDSCFPGCQPSNPDLKYFHGRNGFGDVPLPELDLPPEREELAVLALNRLVSSHPGEVSLVCTGPLTNIALATSTFPSFATTVRDLYIMGGNYTAIGNTTMAAEFNFHTDPEAAQIVLAAFEGKTTLLPWETCCSLRIPMNWREELGKKLTSRVAQLLNTIERPVLERTIRLGYSHYLCCDQLLAATVLYPSLVTERISEHALVELSGAHTRGQIVIDHLKTRKHNISIIRAIDQEAFLKVLQQLA